MYKLILTLFVATLMFGCSKEEAGDAADSAMESVGEMADEAMDKDAEMVDEASDAARELINNDDNEPKLEPLPDWDSLPPIEDEMAEGGETMMEKAEEKAKDMAEDKAEEMMKKE